MPSERIETIFRRDLDRLPGLAESELVPPARRRRLTISGVGALTAIAVLALVVGLSVQAIRDARLAQSDGAAAASSYFIAAESGAEPSTPTTSVIAGNALTGAPVCPVGQLPWIAVSHPPAPGDLPGTGAASAEAAFRRANPAVTEFTMYPWGDGQSARGDDPRIAGGGPVWIVAGSETFIAQAPGRRGDSNNWFAYVAKFMGCKTPSPANLRSTGGG